MGVTYVLLYPSLCCCAVRELSNPENSNTYAELTFCITSMELYGLSVASMINMKWMRLHCVGETGAPLVLRRSSPPPGPYAWLCQHKINTRPSKAICVISKHAGEVYLSVMRFVVTTALLFSFT